MRGCAWRGGGGGCGGDVGDDGGDGGEVDWLGPGC